MAHAASISPAREMFSATKKYGKLGKLDTAADREREWYAVQQGWLRTALELNIKNRLRQRSGVAMTNFEARLPSSDFALTVGNSPE